MSILTTTAIVRVCACALAVGIPALAAAQSGYEDPRPKKLFPPTLTPAPTPGARTALAFDTASCAAPTRMDCAPKSIARERSLAPFTGPTKESPK